MGNISFGLTGVRARPYDWKENNRKRRAHETPDELPWLGRAEGFSPYQRLAAAMILYAVSDMIAGDYDRTGLGYEKGKDAEAWINKTTNELYSFNHCCEILGFEPNDLYWKIILHCQLQWAERENRYREP